MFEKLAWVVWKERGVEGWERGEEVRRCRLVIIEIDM